MADTTTTTLGLTKPEVGASEDSWGIKLNENMDLIDDALDGTTAVSLDINGGTLDGVTIGATVAPTVTNLGSVATADINGGTIDGTVIGGTTPAAISGTTGQFGTSLNVDGTVTADGLTVDGAALLSGQLRFNDNNYWIDNSGGSDISYRSGGTHQFYSGGFNQRLNIASNGDISFYEDTGTTAKFFWDASAAILDVTGTITSDGLTVDGNADVISVIDGTPALDLKASNTGLTAKNTLRFTDLDGSADNYQQAGRIEFYTNDNTNSGVHTYIESTTSTTGYGTIVFGAGLAGSATEAARISSSGHLLVGTTDATLYNNSGGSAVGHNLLSDGSYYGSVSGNVCAVYNRQTSDGDIVQFRKDGVSLGAIGNPYSSARMSIYGTNGTTGSGWYFSNSALAATDHVGILTDNVTDLGTSNFRFDDIYATNGTIQTSDRNEKQDIDVLSEAETRVAQSCKGLLRKFRWKDAVAEKGDDARIHFGIIAQDLQDAFAAEGLDAGRYAMFISSTWWEADEVIPAVEEVLDEEGTVVTEAQPERTVTHHYETAEEAPEGAVERTRLGVRYPELLAFIVAAL